MVSLGTGSTSTVTDVFWSSGGSGRFLNSTVSSAPESISGIVFRDLIGFGLCWIVSVTRRPTSCAQPEFLTLTWNARSVLCWIVFVSLVRELLAGR